jgi:hypothetical protein
MATGKRSRGESDKGAEAAVRERKPRDGKGVDQ